MKAVATCRASPCRRKGSRVSTPISALPPAQKAEFAGACQLAHPPARNIQSHASRNAASLPIGVGRRKPGRRSAHTARHRWAAACTPAVVVPESRRVSRMPAYRSGAGCGTGATGGKRSDDHRVHRSILKNRDTRHARVVRAARLRQQLGIQQAGSPRRNGSFAGSPAR